MIDECSPISGPPAPINDRSKSWQQLWSGTKFYPFNPDPKDVYLEDIAHSLARICRFNGHCKFVYTVAQHCNHVSRIVERNTGDKKLALLGLLHDSAEALCGADLVSPVKRYLPSFRELEHGIFDCIMERFELPWRHNTIPSVIHKADFSALLSEKRDITVDYGHDWGITVEPDSEILVEQHPAIVEKQYVERFYELGGCA